MKRRIAAVAVAAGLALGLSACGVEAESSTQTRAGTVNVFTVDLPDGGRMLCATLTRGEDGVALDCSW
ncbi:hypothetical protein EDD28_0021 [Salana multivorans]|uniref:Uncharacterized protein n=1 Tax=Salana multivorans TaxID=120377 RepID=A0A3N2D739_9MICO|nr:hypothetical protein [Salana multivorans]ROR93078.1 hypothetical protein EDD28_2483 [Salana multivorans]ROR95468.1 hypothetical protein EDD28_0021 [Salana multivorans]